MKEKEIKHKKLRLGIVGFFLFAFFVATIGKLYTIQIKEHERYAGYSRNQYYQKVQINQTRGKILDRNLAPLAITVPVKSVFAHPSQVENREATAKILAAELGMKQESVRKKLEKRANFVWIKRKVTEEQYRSLKNKGLKGVSFLTEDKRFYPHKTFAARAIGFCGIDNQGLAGLEYYYDRMLLGEKAVFVAKKDALGRIYGYAGGRDPNDRIEIVTTIDSRIQYTAEKVVKNAFENYQARAAIAIVMATHTGEILAIAEQPEFDPNRFTSYPTERHKSISVTESFEPGSIFKVFLAAIALDSGLASPNDRFDCENGKLKIGENIIREAGGKKYGMLTFSEIISKSSNIGSVKIASRLGPERFYNYIRRFGFGSRTGIDLPGETPGILKDYKEWSYMSLPSISFGQEITATPVQLVTMLSVIGNGGMSIKPHLLRAVIRNNKVLKEFDPPPPRRIISQDAARQTVEMMRLSVSEGTGRKASVPGYELAGKTGTAQKFDTDEQKYSEDKYIASFMALFPADDPVISILVVVDEPSGAGWGGQVAAPMAKDIAQATARALVIPSRDDIHYLVNWSDLERKYLKKQDDLDTREAGARNRVGAFMFGDATAFEGGL